MNWQKLWNELATQSDPARQVARVREGRPVAPEVVGQIAAYIRSQIDLRPEDRLLDICCGNGALTALLSPYCRETVGLDFSTLLIENARSNHAQTGLGFRCGDARIKSSYPGTKFEKIILYFSFQYFRRKEGLVVIQNAAESLRSGGCILIGDVPDRARMPHFFARRLDRWKYWLRRSLGRDRFGKFWSEREMRAIARALDLEIERLAQPAFMPYRHYRCDYLLYKKPKE